MFARLGKGAFKGLAIGLALGVGFQIALGWFAQGLLGYLLAAGAGATTGLLCGRPPWVRDGWLEGLLKALAGGAAGALLYWVAEAYLQASVPFALAGANEGQSWLTLPLLLMPVIAGLLGALIELDNRPSKVTSEEKPSFL